jgi:hypothetical protein
MAKKSSDNAGAIVGLGLMVVTCLVLALVEWRLSIAESHREGLECIRAGGLPVQGRYDALCIDKRAEIVP